MVGAVSFFEMQYVFRVLIGLPLSIVLYAYDDLLWGPGPIGIFSKIYGWPHGAIYLSILYFVISFVVCFAILNHYSKRKISAKNNQKWLNSKSTGRRGWTYQLLLQGKWLMLALSCFMLGAILTSVIVGRFRLFPKQNSFVLSSIMSGMFVILFLGFYTGLLHVIHDQSLYSMITAVLLVLLVTLLIVNAKRLRGK